MTSLLALILLAALGAAEPDVPADWTIDNFRWTGPLAPASGVEVINPHGDVRTRATAGGEVEISAMIQRRTSDAAAEVKLVRRRGRLTIEVVYPPGPRGEPSRVDLAVFVPEGAPLAVRTRDGMIESRGLASDVDLESAGGDVVLQTTGTARVATRDGDITLRLPPDADARVRIRASGGISVQMPASLKRRPFRRAVVTVGDVTLGRGARTLSLKTRRGGVTLLAAQP